MSPAFWRGFVKGAPQGVITGFAICLAWIVVANLVFAFRHPHLTDTERFLRFGQALRFEKVQP